MWSRRIASATEGAVLAATLCTMAAVGVLAATVGVPAPAARAGGPGVPLIGDLDADGRADRAWLVTLSTSRCAIRLERGDGQGGYLAPVLRAYRPPVGAGCPDLGVAVDLGGDGRTELVLGRFAGTPGGAQPDLVVLRDFQISAGYRALRRPNVIGLADFNGDGRLDVYTWTDQGEGFASYLNTALGTLVPGPVRYCSGPSQYELVDVNGNGATDVVTAYLDGCAGFARGVAVVLDDGRRVDLVGESAGRHGWTVHVLDANQDGNADVTAYRQPAGEMTTYLGRGDGSFVRSPLAVPDVATVGTTPIQIPVTANDYASTRARISLVTPPVAGTAQIVGPSVRYVPAESYLGTDRFVYRLTQDGRSSTAEVRLMVVGASPADAAHRVG
jgi:hypothetical protein